MLDVLPLLVALAGLVLYTVLAGADFGAGFWQLVAGRGQRARAVRDHAHRANAPIWEANHVWLILDLTVLWTAYPTVFGSVCSTLALPMFLAAVGIILRGLCYTLQTATEDSRERRVIDLSFAASSILTPFMLGAMLGGVASGRVPVGNAKGDLLTSWINPTSIVSGALAVAVGAFLAAVYLAADARRFTGADMLAEAFRRRALGAGGAAGALALGGLLVLRSDARPIYDGLTAGWGLVATVISVAAGVSALALVWARRFPSARLAAGLAVAGVLAGWGAAQRPDVLPGMTLAEASADHGTMVSVLVSVAAGAVILFPSLALLFRLTLTGQLDRDAQAHRRVTRGQPDAKRPAWSARAAVASLVVAVALLTLADAGVAHAVGVVALGSTALFGYQAVGPDLLAAQPSRVHVEPPPRGPRW